MWPRAPGGTKVSAQAGSSTLTWPRPRPRGNLRGRRLIWGRCYAGRDMPVISGIRAGHEPAPDANTTAPDRGVTSYGNRIGIAQFPPSHPDGSDITDWAWHDSYVPVVFLITIAAVLVGIFFAATGRGGELAYEHADHAPLDLGPVSAADIALLRPPTALWGYNMQVTDEALDRIARAMRERDVTIAYLQEQVAAYERNGSYAEPKGAHARQAPDAPYAPYAPPVPAVPPAPE